MTYLYQPSTSGQLTKTDASTIMPLRQNAGIQPLLSSTDERFAGREGVLGDETKGVGTDAENFKGKSGALGSSSLSGTAGSSGLTGLS
jgi:hypothetical protein